MAQDPLPRLATSWKVGAFHDGLYVLKDHSTTVVGIKVKGGCGIGLQPYSVHSPRGFHAMDKPFSGTIEGLRVIRPRQEICNPRETEVAKPDRPFSPA